LVGGERMNFSTDDGQLAAAEARNRVGNLRPRHQGAKGVRQPESLVIPFDCADYRTAAKWTPDGPTLRLHVGLEHVDVLKADLDRGLAAFNAGYSL
jgi:hypothetical protein